MCPMQQTMSKLKIGVVAALAIVLVIVILQNTQQVETKILFLTMTMPRAVLLFAAIVVGWVLGLLTGGRWMRKVK